MCSSIERVDRDPSLIDSSGLASFETPDLRIAPALSSEVVLVQMTESPCPTLMERTSQGTVPRDSLRKLSLLEWLAAFARVQMRVRRTPSGAALLPWTTRINASDGREPALTNEREDRRGPCWTRQSVDLWRRPRGDKGRVAMELGCDYGDLSSILSVSQSLPILDLSQVERFSQQDVRHLVHTISALTVSSWDVS